MRIEDLKVGDELECIDRNGFLNERRNAEYLLHNKMIVSDMNEHEIYLRCDDDEKSCRNYIYVHELKYFKKKEQYTFDDLIDVAKKAVRDRVLQFFTFGSDFKYLDLIRVVSIDNSKHIFDYQSAESGIKYIQSLYKETFVIQNNHCVLKIKTGAKIKFSHYEAVAKTDGIESAPYNYVEVQFYHTDNSIWKVPHRLLVGATVEQEVSCE